jgi:hypothetical protein
VVQLPDGLHNAPNRWLGRGASQAARRRYGLLHRLGCLGTSQFGCGFHVVLLKPWDERKQGSISAVLNSSTMGSWPRSALRWHSASIFPRSREAALRQSRSQLAGPRHRRPEVRRLVNEFVRKRIRCRTQAFLPVRSMCRSLSTWTGKVKSWSLWGMLGPSRLSTIYINDFNLYGRTYRVQLRRSRVPEKPVGTSTCEATVP